MSLFYFNDDNILFNHIPKTGGLTIRRNLLDARKKTKYYYYKDMPQIAKECPSFAFVRNPYDRFISCWAYAQDKLHKELCKYWVLDIIEDESIPLLPHIHKREPNNFIRHHGVPMTHGFNSIDKIETIHRFENYDNAVKYVCLMFGVRANNIPRTNNSRRKDYKSYYDEDLKKRVGQVFEKDIDTFKYTF